MKTQTLLALLLATAMAFAGASVAVGVALQRTDVAPADDAHAHHAGAHESEMHGGMAGDAPHEQVGMERPRFPQASGSVPTADEASRFEQFSFAAIQGDDDFEDSDVVSGGDGTLESPYRITGLHITRALEIADTSKCFEVAGNWVDGQLRLNWNGPCVWVHHNFVRDLRVNENIPRTGADTGGLIELNKINYVGQIRHYDGEFRDNVVGPRQDDRLPQGIFDDPENPIPFFKDTRILNIDGWNQGLFHHNTVYGSVDLKLHGHHHGTGFLAPHSHYHGDGEAPAHDEDHTRRWSSVSFTDNRIIDPQGYGLRYTDQMHSGDDQTAASESNEDLERAHMHRTLVDISRNVLEGAGIWVDVFNAEDRLHKESNPGWFTIADNTVSLTERREGLLGEQFFGPWYEPNTAIWVWGTQEAQFTITGNTLRFQAGASADPLAPLDPVTRYVRWGPDETPKAISIQEASDGTYTVADNRGEGFEFGVKGSFMDEDVAWAVYGNTWSGVANELAHDDSVANEPSDEPLPPGPGPYDEEPEAARHEESH
jgi:hypothetical protein